MIYVSHGLVKSRCNTALCHMHLSDYYLFEKKLENKKKFVSLDDGIMGHGDAFTIDDAIYAAMDAALLLRSYGHHVSLFVNCYYIENNINHWFSVLNCIMDQYKKATIKYLEKSYPCNHSQERMFVRSTIKNALALLDSEEERYDCLSRIFQLDAKSFDVPKYLATINYTDLLHLKNKGVDIQNHGWTHKQLLHSPMTVVDNEIKENKDCINRRLDIDSKYFAAPYGERLPPQDYGFPHCDYWLSVLRSASPGFIGTRTYNRVNFDL